MLRQLRYTQELRGGAGVRERLRFSPGFDRWRLIGWQWTWRRAFLEVDQILRLSPRYGGGQQMEAKRPVHLPPRCRESKQGGRISCQLKLILHKVHKIQKVKSKHGMVEKPICSEENYSYSFDVKSKDPILLYGPLCHGKRTIILVELRVITPEKH